MESKTWANLYFYLLFSVLILFFSINAQAYTWVRVHPAIVGDILDVACDTTNDICVAVGKYGSNNQYGEILYRDNNGHWTQVSKNVQYPPLKDVEFGGGKFLAISSNKVYMSSDGQNWTKIYDNSSLSFGVLGPAMNLAFGNNHFVATNYNGSLSCDLNGSCSYHQIVNYPPYSFTGIAFGSNKFVIYGEKFTTTDYPYVWTSSDGINFDNTSLVNNLGTGKKIYSMAYGGGIFLGSIENSNSSGAFYIYSSNNGTSWSSTGVNGLTYCTIKGFCKSKFLAKMEYSGSNDYYIYNSQNGSSWSEVSSLDTYVEKVAPSGSGCVAVGDDGYIAESSDGDNWTRVSQSNEDLRRVKYLNNYFYALGNKGTVIYSSDGNTWTEETIPGVQDYMASDIAYNGSTLVVVGRGWNVTGGFIAHKNGNGWTVDNTTSFDLSGITYGDGKFIAVGHGKILSSTDGSNWTEVNINDNISNIYLKSVIYANGVYVAVGSDDTILTSNDGTNWVKDNLTTTMDLQDVTYGAGKFIAVGYSSTVLISSDGFNWEAASQSTPNNSWIQSVTHDGSEFVALDFFGSKIYTSENGDSWANSGQITMPSGGLHSITYGNGMLITVGSEGLIFRSSLHGIAVSASVSKDTTSPGQPLTFTCSASGGSGSYTYYWDFNGDGVPDNVTTDSSATYTYNSYGIYYATVKVVDSDNNTATSSYIKIKVKPQNGDVGSVNVRIDNATPVFSVTGITDNATIDNMSSSLSFICTTLDCTSLENQGITFKYKINVGLTLNSGATSTRITLKNVPLIPGVKNLFYKYINGTFIDLADNTTCGNCNFTRTDNLTAHTTTISFTVTDGGVLDADGTINGKISDPVVVATQTTSPPPSPSSSGGGGGCTVSNSPSVGLLLILLTVIGFGIKRKFER